MRRLRWLVVLFVAAMTASAQEGGQPALIAQSDPLTPAEQREKFNLPEGFEIQLVAAEPDIDQPMNLNFDARGRLWVTHSTEYPFPAGEAFKEDQSPRDSISVISGIGADGSPQEIRTFAEGLNIPIGVLPLGDRVLAHSIPNVWEWRDKDGDGEADERQPLLTGIGHDDTHGMTNSFTWWVDGWVYATHGFSNTSNIEDRTGNTLTMNSGNTYRFSPDGAGLEQWVHGQVNPFGLAFDPLGNLYSADCHSRPLYMLLRGAYYPSFGKPHDGLGFGPEMIDHAHGSTGIAGAVYYDGEQFPSEYRDCLYVGNVITRRVHRDRLEDHGSTRLADTQPDFITCDDPWFRPVDIQLGPDGALYIADFYNPIIGHYEVPLDHPDRDHHRGRIWRVVYTGDTDDDATLPAGPDDLSSRSVEELFEALASANLTRRVLATHELVAREDAVEAVRRVVTSFEAEPTQRAHGLWVLHRRGALSETLIKRLADDPHRLVRVHLVRALAERTEWSAAVADLVRKATTDEDAFVRRAAADALGRHPHADHVKPLLALWRRTSEQDTHLVHQTRIGLRDQLRDESVAAAVRERELSADELARLAEVAIAAANAEAAAIVLDYLQQADDLPPERLEAYLSFAANHVPADRTDVLATLMRQRYSDDPAFELSVLLSIREGLARSGTEPTQPVREWATEVAAAVLKGSAVMWENRPVPGKADSPNPWTLGERENEHGEPMRLLSSFPHGEQLTGILRSRLFKLPREMSFYMAGHNGPPDQTPEPRNLVRLRHADTDAVIAETLPPRSDTAHRYTWDLSDHVGDRGYIEIVDGNDEGAWAWLAVGGFDPPRIQVPATGPAEQLQTQRRAMELAAAFDLADLTDLIAQRLTAAGAAAVRIEAAQALPQLDVDRAVEALGAALRDLEAPHELREAAARQLGQVNRPAARETLVEHLEVAASDMAARIAAALVQTREGAAALLVAVEEGQASPRLLTAASIAEPLRERDLPDVDERVEALTADLPAADARLSQLIEQRRKSFVEARAENTLDTTDGQTIFMQQCAACHSLDDVGGDIGPDLDGVGSRGVQRLLEDILAPNRAVDQAFRLSTIELADGRVIAGTVRRREGETLVVADPAGQEQRVSAGEVVELTGSARSLMPPNYADILSEPDLHALLAYLLEQAGERE